MLKQLYPNVFQNGVVQTFGKYSKLIKLKGSDPEKLPLLLTAHMDVVPVDQKNIDKWDFPPFSGQIHDGFIYGRGTLDDKCSLLGILEAVEALISNGFQPKRDLYLAFGEDEEISGLQGAGQIAANFRKENIHFKAILDEGGILASGIVPGLEDRTVALIGTSEKGYLTLALSCELEGGHSSMPEHETALGKLNRALHLLNDAPFPKRLTSPLKGFMRYLGPELPFFQKMAFANAKIFSQLIFRIYNKSASSRALIRTTIAPTMFNSGIKSNVIPTNAALIVNFRLLPGETIDSVVELVRKTINDPDIKIERKGFANNPTKVSLDNTDEFRLIGQTVRQVFRESLISPYLTLATTDVRHYEDLSGNIYRFLPITLTKDDLKRIHGINERINIEAYKKAILFYQAFILNFDN
jgi:carboxypeptidase PM20D1